MANIHLNRARQSLGQFTPEEVAAGLNSGRFLPTDLAWTEGMESWKPLAEFPGLPVVEEAAPILAPGIETIAPPLAVEPAWERRPELGFFAALIQTIKDVIAKPGEVFGAMNPTGGLKAPLSFYLIVGTLTGMVAVFYQFAVTLVDPSSLGKEFEGAGTLALAGIFLVVVILLPLLLAVGSFITAGVLHLSLMLIGGAKQPFQATFRASSYANGATLVFQLIPVCGGIIAWIYGIVLTVIGVQKVHGIDLSKATIAVLLPIVLCCGAVFALVALGGAAGWSSIMEEIAKQPR